MPCATVHLYLAEEVWTAWDSGRLPSPFTLTEETRCAFLHGSLAPDLGFVPGVDRWVSLLAHYHRPADLTRAVLREAGDDREVAFAWGWVAHVLGDIALHPQIGYAVGEELHGDRSRRVNAIEDVETHVAIEVGLDAQVLDAHGYVPEPPEKPFFDRRSIGLIQNALVHAYGIRIHARVLEAWHCRAVARTRPWPAALRLLSRRYDLIPDRAQPRSVGSRVLIAAARRLVRPGTAAAGFFRPRRPPRWLFEAVWTEGRGFPDRLRPFLERGLADLENRNLESGALQHPHDPHPEAVRAKERLEAIAAARLD